MSLLSSIGDGIKNLLGGGDTTVQQKSSPWGPQGTALKTGFKAAAGIYGDQFDSAAPNMQYAGMDPNTLAALQGIYGYQPQGAANAGALTGNGMTLANAGTAGSQGAINTLGNWQAQDPTQANITNAGMYANNPNVDGMIDAASRDVRRNLSEVQLPGIARNAVGTGNMNSSRTGIAEGIAMRGAQDQIGDISANIRGNLYNQGLQLAEQARATNQGDYLNAQTQAGGLSNNATINGFNGIGSGQGLAYNNFDAQAAAGNQVQSDKQGLYDTNYQNSVNQDNRPWDVLSKYMSMIQGNYGQTSTTNTPGTGWAGVAKNLLGAASAGLGLYGSYKNLNQVGSQ